MSESGPSKDFCRPPKVSAEVECIHCGQVYSSSQIRWESGSVSNPDRGFWRCPTAGCDGAGFLFDIWPTDPNYRDVDGNKVFFDGSEELIIPDQEPPPADAFRAN
jgi:hypothetical protein